MIKKDSLEEVWITDIAKKHKSDPILVEKVVRALYLLELLQQSELSFIFKGGTALMLMLTEPKRFSIDIDIIVSDKPENMDDILSTLISNSDFLEVKKDERTINSKIEKEHYKFYYKPVTNARTEAEYILLDILFEESHYGKHVQQIPIRSLFILTEGNDVAVTVPITEAILGDKLTAYAPNTTGIPYGRDKEVEIIKQLFDIGHLFDSCENVETINAVFQQFAAIELSYREMNDLTPDDVLDDIFQTGLVICTRGSSGIGRFDELQKGIHNIRTFIFSESFHIDRAIIYAAKAAYISTLLKTETKEMQRFKNPLEIADWMIEQPYETKLNKLKKSNPEAFFYWYQIIELTK
jgi:hypothetical protein